MELGCGCGQIGDDSIGHVEHIAVMRWHGVMAS